MRLLSQSLIAMLAGATVILGISSCGQPMPPTSARANFPAAPAFELLQTGRALHYIIDSEEKAGNTLKADVWVYQSGRVTVTADMTSAGDNPTALIRVRLTNREGRTLWQTTNRTRFCEGEECGRTTRRQIWNHEVGPRVAARASNLWLRLEILE